MYVHVFIYVYTHIHMYDIYIYICIYIYIYGFVSYIAVGYCSFHNAFRGSYGLEEEHRDHVHGVRRQGLRHTGAGPEPVSAIVVHHQRPVQEPRNPRGKMDGARSCWALGSVPVLGLLKNGLEGKPQGKTHFLGVTLFETYPKK